MTPPPEFLVFVYVMGTLGLGVMLSVQGPKDMGLAEQVAAIILWPICIAVLALLGIRHLVKRALTMARIP